MRLTHLLLGAACLLATSATSTEDTIINLLTPNYTEVNRGSTVTFKCEFIDLVPEDMIIWKKGNDEPLFMDLDPAMSDDRYNVDISEMTISNIQVHEDTTFYCGTMETDRFIATKVRVQVPPTAHINPEVWPYSVSNGSPATLTCIVSGNPTPRIHWSKEGGAIAAHISVEGKTLYIPAVKKTDAGIYSCFVNSTAGEVTAKIDMRVHDHVASGGNAKPWIRASAKYVPVEMGGIVNISCQYDGNPHPQIEWSFNGVKLTLAKDMVRSNQIKQFATREADYSESILQISDVTADYFGDYSCRAVNGHGDDKQAVFVTAMPSQPELSIEETILTMTAMAPNGIDEFALFFRRPDESGWLNKKAVTVSKVDQTGDKTWSKQINLMDFLESGNFEIQVQARNGYGYGNKASDMIRVNLPERSEAPTAASSLTVFSSAIAAIILFFAQ